MRYLIDSHDITDYNRSKRELQTFWLFCVLVAGKNSEIQAKKLAEFLGEAPHNMLPFTYLDHLIHTDQLGTKMVEHKLGQYARLDKCFRETLYWVGDVTGLTNAPVWIFERISGVGPKTARFFLTHTRESCNNFAVLDTHVLRWMRETLDVPTPKATPSGERYNVLEQVFLREAQRRGVSTAELDLQVWSSYNKGNEGAV